MARMLDISSLELSTGKVTVQCLREFKAYKKAYKRSCRQSLSCIKEKSLLSRYTAKERTQYHAVSPVSLLGSVCQLGLLHGQNTSVWRSIWGFQMVLS